VYEPYRVENPAAKHMRGFKRKLRTKSDRKGHKKGTEMTKYS